MQNKFCFLLSMIIFGAMGVFAKFISLPAEEIAFCLSSIGTLILLTIFLWKHAPISPKTLKNNFFLLLTASFLLSGNWIFLFKAYKETTLANAALSYYLAPVLVLLAAPCVLRENFSKKRTFCILLAFLGLCLVLQNSLVRPDGTNLMGIENALLAAAFYAALTLTNKFIKGIDGLTTTFFQLALSSAFLLLYILFLDHASLVIPKKSDTLLLLILGIGHGGMGFYLFFSGMRHLSGQSIAVLSYADPLTTLLLSAFFLQEPFTTQQMVGAFLLFSAIWLAEKRTTP